MTAFANATSSFATKPRFGVIFLFIVASLLLSHVPYVNWVLAPINLFVVSVHEMSHAVVCLLTGGHVGAMTIVNDGQGHGGNTFCSGGMPFFYSQAGYLGTAVFGCLLIALGRFHKLSKAVLVLLGATFGLSSFTFMFGAVMQGNVIQGLLSMVCGLAMAAGFIWVGLKLNHEWANMLLLFIGVQTSLNAVDSITWLFNPAGVSDADNMAKMTMIPAPFWAVSWLLFAVVAVCATLWWTYKADTRRVNTI